MNFKSDFNSLNSNHNLFESSLFPSSISNRFNNDPFFSRAMNFDSFFGDFDQRFDNSTINNNNQNNFNNNFEDNFLNSRFDLSNMNQNTPGSHFVSKSYCSTVSYNGSGEPIREVFKSEAYNTVDQTGKKIGESKTAYENTAKGIQKAAHEKHLNDKAYKVVKEKELNTGEEIESNYYKGLNENELNDFNSEFTRYKDEVKNNSGRLGANERFASQYNNDNLNNHNNKYLGYEGNK